MNKSLPVPFLTLAITALLASATNSTAKDTVREELHQTHPLKADGRVQVDNVNGKIDIKTWDREEVKLDAVKAGDSQADLDEVKIEIDAKPDQIRINTKHPSGNRSRKGNSTKVDYTLTVPVKARLDKINNVNGSITIDGARGPVDASTVNGSLAATGLAADTEVSSVNGSVKAAFAHMNGVKSIQGKSVNGTVTIVLPDKANATLDVSTVNGGISTDFDVPVKKNWPVGRELKGTLGDGGTKVRASTVNGGVKISKGAGS